MIIGDLHPFRPGVGPYETYPPLVIDADRVLSGTVILQGLKRVARRRAQVAEFVGGIEHGELSLRAGRTKSAGKPFGGLLPAAIPSVILS